MMERLAHIIERLEAERTEKLKVIEELTADADALHEAILAIQARVRVSAPVPAPVVVDVASLGNPFSVGSVGYWTYEVLREAEEPWSVDRIAERVLAVRQGTKAGVRSTLYSNHMVFEKCSEGHFRLAKSPTAQ
jgi:hypothetical protein